MADLILVSGLPATGKTTLAAKLKTDLGLPLLGKDMLNFAEVEYVRLVRTLKKYLEETV